MSHSKASAQSGSLACHRKARDHALARALVTHRVEDRVVGKQRVVREVHLRHEPLHEGATEQREVDVRRPPGVVMVAPRVRSRLDRREAVASIVVGDRATRAGEVRVERGGPAVPAVLVASGGVRLPDLDERAAQGLPLGVEHAAAERDSLADRLAGVLAREVVVELAEDALATELWTGDLGDRLRHEDERLLRVAQTARLVRRVVERRLLVLALSQVAVGRIGDRLVDGVRLLGAGFAHLLHS